MILHDAVTITPQEVDGYGYSVPGEPVVVAAQVDPLTTTETALVAGSGSQITTRYKMVTGTDLGTIGHPAAVRVDWRGDRMTVVGGWERHSVNGQFDHCEAFLTTST